MKQNVGTTDRIIRLMVAAIFAVLYFSHLVPGTLGIVLLVLAVIFTLTAATGICPIYMGFKLSTKNN